MEGGQSDGEGESQGLEQRPEKKQQTLKMYKKPRNHTAFGWERLPRSTALKTQAVLLCLQTRPSEHALLQLLQLGDVSTGLPPFTEQKLLRLTLTNNLSMPQSLWQH